MAVIGPNYVFNVQTRFCIPASNLKRKELINMRIKGIILMFGNQPSAARMLADGKFEYHLPPPKTLLQSLWVSG